jgi:hypothetical protein
MLTRALGADAIAAGLREAGATFERHGSGWFVEGAPSPTVEFIESWPQLPEKLEEALRARGMIVEE